MIRIEHPVPDYDAWKRAFDRDPLNRKASGVRRFKILRSVQTPNHVLIDLELESLAEAESLLTALQTMWGKIEGTVISNVRAQIVLLTQETQL